MNIAQLQTDPAAFKAILDELSAIKINEDQKSELKDETNKLQKIKHAFCIAHICSGNLFF